VKSWVGLMKEIQSASRRRAETALWRAAKAERWKTARRPKTPFSIFHPPYPLCTFFMASIGVGGSIHALKCQETCKLNSFGPFAGWC